MQLIFSWGSGIDDPTLAIGQSCFVEFWSNSVRFSTFLYTEWEFLHVIFTTTRYLYHKNRISERAGSLSPIRLHPEGFRTIHY